MIGNKRRRMRPRWRQRYWVGARLTEAAPVRARLDFGRIVYDPEGSCAPSDTCVTTNIGQWKNLARKKFVLEKAVFVF